MKKGLCLFLLCLSLIIAPSCFSQSLQGSVQEADILQTSLRDVGIISGATALGALLGASTLSFVSAPQEHLDRILIGGSLGLILGVGIVIYFQATKSTQIYNKHAYHLMPKDDLWKNFEPPPLTLLSGRMKSSSPFIQHRLTF